MSSGGGRAGPAGVPPGAGQQPSQEELQEYLTQMRGAPVEQVIAEVLQALLNSAQVKIGRKDGRLLIDIATTVAEKAGPHVSDQVAEQIDQALSKLRMAQVDAENELDEARARGEDVAEPNDLGAAAEGGQDVQDAPSEGGGGHSSGAASKLWTPGG